MADNPADKMFNENRQIRVHFKNRRASPTVYHVTAEILDEACRRHPDLASRINPSIGYDTEEFDYAMETAEVLVGFRIPTGDLSSRAPHLKWIHVTGAGIDHLTPLDWLPRGVIISTSSGVHAEKAGEYAAMAISMLNNCMPHYIECQARREWHQKFTTPLSGKTLVVIGVGHMGGAAAVRAKQLGLRVIGVRNSGRPHPAVDDMFKPDGLDEALRDADFVLVSVPLTSATLGLIDKNRLGLMKPSAGLINMARAEVVDYRALADKLVQGELSGAILDVFDPEPLLPDSFLWDVPNLILTPHVSSDDPERYIPDVLDLLFANIECFLSGKPLLNQIDPEREY